MTSYRRSTPLTHLACASESGGAYDADDRDDRGAFDGRTGRFDLFRSPDGDPVHTTYPNGTQPKPIGTEVG